MRDETLERFKELVILAATIVALIHFLL